MKTINQNVEGINIQDIHFIKDVKNNKLYEVEPVEIFAPIEGDTQLIFKNGDAEIRIGIHDVECYKSRSAFETGATPNPIIHFETERLQRMSKFSARTFGDDSMYMLRCIVIKDGVPTEIDAPIKGVIFSKWGNLKDVVWEDGFDTKHVYKTVEQSIRFNNYKYTNENGDETEREGTCSFALLTDAQKKAVAKLKKAFDELKAANVTATYSSDYGEWYFVPADKTTLDYDDASEDEAFLVTAVPEDQSFTAYIGDFCCAPTVSERTK